MAVGDEQGAFAWASGLAVDGEGDGRPAPVGRGDARGGKGTEVHGRRGKGTAVDSIRRQDPKAERLPPDDELWDVRAAARFLRRSVSWVYHKAEDGTLPARRLGGWGVRFIPAELRAWVESGAGKGGR